MIHLDDVFSPKLHLQYVIKAPVDLYTEEFLHDSFTGQVLDCHLLEAKEIKSHKPILHSKGTMWSVPFCFLFPLLLYD